MRIAPVASLALGLIGCSQGVPVQAVAPADVQVDRPACSYALAEPVALAADTNGDYGPGGANCVPPSPGTDFKYAFGWSGGDYFVLHLARPLTLDTLLPIESMHGVVSGVHCTDWRGTVQVGSDTASDWALNVDAACAAASDVKVRGSFAGHFQN